MMPYKKLPVMTLCRLVNVLIEEVARVEMSEAVTMVPPPGPAALGLYCCWFIGCVLLLSAKSAVVCWMESGEWRGRLRSDLYGVSQRSEQRLL